MALQKKKKNRTLAVIFAGYDKFNLKTKLRLRKEIIESYDGDEIFLGTNKFLYDVNGKAVIQYVLDAVYLAKKDGKRIYDEIYVYNDRESFEKVIDISKYHNLVVRQMADSVAGHLKDFYQNFVEYGDSVDMFFGDTPRITPGDVAWVHDEYGKIIGRKKDQRGVPVRIAYGVVRFTDMDDNWLPHRIKYFKRGAKKGRIKSYVQFENYQGRVANSLAFVKHPSLDPMIEHEVVNLFYNIRKALTPRAISRIMYYL